MLLVGLARSALAAAISCAAGSRPTPARRHRGRCDRARRHGRARRCRDPAGTAAVNRPCRRCAPSHPPGAGRARRPPPAPPAARVRHAGRAVGAVGCRGHDQRQVERPNAADAAGARLRRLHRSRQPAGLPVQAGAGHPVGGRGLAHAVGAAAEGSAARDAAAAGAAPAAPRPRRRGAPAPEIAGATTGGLEIDSRPTGARVFVDDRRGGHDAGPAAGGHARQPRRPAGTAGTSRRGRKTRASHPGQDHARRGIVGTNSMKAILALENGIWYEGESAGAPGRDRRRSRVQHQHDRLSGSADRPVVRRPDRHHDLPGDRQLRRRPARTSSRRRRRSPASSSAPSRRSPATGAPTARCATTWSATTSSRSPTSTRAR